MMLPDGRIAVAIDGEDPGVRTDEPVPTADQRTRKIHGAVATDAAEVTTEAS
jgi:hypothetical protein